MTLLKQLLILLLLPFAATAKDYSNLNSPSGKLTAQINIDSDHVTVNLNSGQQSIKVQTLQFTTEKKIIEGDWQLIHQQYNTQNNTWQPVYGEQELITDHYNEVLLTFESKKNQKNMLLTVRLYDEGLAFKYTFNQLDFWNCVVTGEQTTFTFLSDCKVWASGNAQGAIGQTTLNQLKGTADRPLLIQMDNRHYAAVGEAALVDYARMKLKKGSQPNTIESVLSSKVNLCMAGYTTPWRYVMIGQTPGELVENNYFLLNLNEPNQIENTAWIKPGKVIREVTLTTAGGLACIDFAARNQIEYVEFDAGWYGPEDNKESDASTITVDPARSKGPLDLHKVIEYANQKDVGIIVYVNMKALAKQLDQILPLYKKWGIKGIKYGFVDVGDQYSTSWLHHAVRKAAKYELMVDIHDEYRPTGYSRTYPNLMTQEGIRGDEESPSLQQTVYTFFTRMIAGAGDYTNCFFAERVSAKMGGKAAQMAKAIIIYSPWQFVYWYDRPFNSPHKTGGAGSAETLIVEDKSTEFYRHLPTIWNESNVLTSELDKPLIVARRNGNDWYLGIINAGDKQEISIPFDFLKANKEYKANLYHQTANDLKKNHISIKTIDIKKSLQLLLEANSGCVIHIQANNQ